ncbi:MAG: cardiolipin synthase [Chthoniobacterales bacterium]
MRLHLKTFFERASNSPRAVLRLLRAYRKRIIAGIFVVAQILGALTSVEAIMENRTPQGAVAWVVALNAIPIVALPAYWIFGHSDFEGYVIARKDTVAAVDPVLERILTTLKSSGDLRTDTDDPFLHELESLAGFPFTSGNDARLLIDGQETFDAIFQAIDSATEYILVQYYILRPDKIGNALKDRLIRKARDGVKVYVLYDSLGSMGLTDEYLNELDRGGVHTRPFSSTSDLRRFQINFRNHRKIVVVDGRIGFTGGLNFGMDYLGHNPELSPWRDTHIQIKGPSVQFLQIPFAEDWYWASQELLADLDWTPAPSPDGGDLEILSIPTGPADKLDTCALTFLAAINHARKRIWIASPYFVPDVPIIYALQLAALRGVDVRILLPKTPDSLLVFYSSFAYLPDVDLEGISVFRYTDGFLHQKVVLIDDDFSTVGTANFDNRSFRLNFEVTLAVRDRNFASQVEKMLLADFDRSELAPATDMTEASFFFRLKARASRLLAPIQ